MGSMVLSRTSVILAGLIVLLNKSAHLTAPKPTERPPLDYSGFDQVKQQLYSTYSGQQDELQFLVNDVLSDGTVGNSTLEYYQLAVDCYSKHLDKVLRFCTDKLEALFKVVVSIADVDDHEAAKIRLEQIKGGFQNDIVLMNQDLVTVPQQSLQRFKQAVLKCRNTFICAIVAGVTSQAVKELPPQIRKRFWSCIGVGSEKLLLIVSSYIQIVESYNDNRADFIDDHLPDYLFENKTS